MLTLKNEGDLWLTVLSNNSVFVQSRLLDIQSFQTIPSSSDTSNTEDLNSHECCKYVTVKV